MGGWGSGGGLVGKKEGGDVFEGDAGGGGADTLMPTMLKRGTSSNHLERAGTNWSHLERAVIN